MKTIALGMLGASALIASTLAAQAQKTDDPGVEFAFMPRTMTVTLRWTPIVRQPEPSSKV
jgi:Spy/CpxP family protein refolding chaperone